MNRVQGVELVINCVGIVYKVWFYWTKLNANIKGRVMTAVMTALAKKYHIRVMNSLNIQDDAHNDCTPHSSDHDAWTMIG